MNTLGKEKGMNNVACGEAGDEKESWLEESSSIFSLREGVVFKVEGWFLV